MGTEYRLVHTNATGAVVKNEISDYFSISYVRALNKIGSMTVELPAAYTLASFEVDDRLFLLRKPAGGSWDVAGGTCFFVRSPLQELSADGTEIIRLDDCPDAIQLLERRIVAYATDTVQAIKNAEADDVMKEVVAENLGASATDTDRDISTYLSIDADLTAAPVVYHEFGWREVLRTLQELASSSSQNGTLLFFDVTSKRYETLTFRTFTDRRGSDRTIGSGNGILFTVENGTLKSASVVRNARDEKNYAYVGGQGQGSARPVAEIENASRTGASPLNRHELWVDARTNSATATGNLADDGRAALYQNRPFWGFEGAVQDTRSTVYGREYRFGDVVTARYAGLEFDCHVDRVALRVEQGREQIDVRLRGEIPIS